MKLLIDGDLLAFKLAASLELKWVEYNGEVFKTTTLAKKECVLNGVEYDESLLVKKSSIVDDWENELSTNYDWKMKGLKYWVRPTSIELVLGVGDSFRCDIAKMQKYKGSRDNADRPTMLGAVRGWLAHKHKTHYSTDGDEGDDLLVRMAVNDTGFVIASSDKDFWGCPVKVVNLDNPTRPENADQFGKLFRSGVSVKGIGRIFFYHQLLFGDGADDYKPFIYSNTVRKFGEISVMNLLTQFDNDQDCVDAVVEKYKEAYPDPFDFKCPNGVLTTYTWKDALQEIIDCAYMRRSQNDRLTVDQFMNLEHITRGVYGS